MVLQRVRQICGDDSEQLRCKGIAVRRGLGRSPEQLLARQRVVGGGVPVGRANEVAHAHAQQAQPLGQGHALEALSNYRIPHGVGVTLGILVENEIAFRRGMLPAEDRELMLQLGRQIVPREFWKTFTQTSLSGVLDLFRRDKKSEGQVLKLATPEFIGQMRFIDFDLTASGEEELRRAVASVLEAS